MQEKNYHKLSSIEKAAIIFMSADENNITRLFENFDEHEIKQMSQTMANLGTVPPDVIETVLDEFSTRMTDTLSFVGNLDSTEKMLQKVLAKEQVNNIMEDIRGPAGRNTWDKLGNISEELLAGYLKNEYPQTASLVVSRISSAHAARVLSVLPDDFAFEVIMRMLTMDSVKKEVLDNLESTLKSEFISTLTKTQKLDNNEMLAEIFNNFDRNTETKYMTMLEEQNLDAADRIKSLMFTFDDLTKIDPGGIQEILRNVDKAKLAIALKGASEDVRTLFLDNMSGRAAKIMQEDMEAMGPVRLRDVDEAQTEIITTTKTLATAGTVVIADGTSGDDELVY